METKNTKNTLGALNDLLFKQLERLDNVDIKNESELQGEAFRASSVARISKQVIHNANTMISAQRLVIDKEGRSNVEIPKMLTE